MDAIHRHLATRIRQLARSRKMSMNRLADFAGLGRGYVSDVLAGKKSPTLRTLAKIAGALEVPVTELLA